MRTTYIRLFADEAGVSHFEDVDIELLPGFAAPPAEPLHVAHFLETAQCSWIGGTSDWKGEISHPVPRRMLLVVVTGEGYWTAGDGSVRSYKPGTVVLAEDTWGTGHGGRITSAEGSVSLVFALPNLSE